MNVRELQDFAIKIGIGADPRPQSLIQKRLDRYKKQYENLSKEEKTRFDMDRLINPYMDGGIHYDSGVKKIKRVLAGIDVDSAEMMVGRYICNHDPAHNIDVVIGHHPVGKGLAYLHDVMDLKIDVYQQYGVPVNISEDLENIRISEVSRGLSASNHYKVVDTARALNIALVNVHTPCDNLAWKFVSEKIKKDNPEYVGDVIKSLMEIPEYVEGRKRGAGPVVFAGSESSRAGKIIVDFTGGTSGSKEMYAHLAQAGIGTIIGMHQSEEHRKEAQQAHINIVIAGHIASDSIGMNLFLDELEKKGIEVIPCSGLIRVSRVKK